MEWISFFGPRRPINGQKIFYYGEFIGVWSGNYSLDWKDPVSPHRIICGERSNNEVLAKYGLDNLTMMVDRMDAEIVAELVKLGMSVTAELKYDRWQIEVYK